METTPLDAARDDAHRLHVELAFVPLSLMSAAAGGSAVVGPFVEALSPGAMPLTVQIALVVVAVGNGLCALRARVDQRWAPQIGVAIWLWVIALLPGAGPIGATNPIVLLCMAVGATVGSITAPGSWRWGPIAGLAWLTGQMLVDVAPEARVPLLLFPPVILTTLSLVVSRMMTRLVRSEASYAAALEHLAAANEELGEARERADRANQAKSAFLASMSHELRTPLNAIIGYSELIMDAPQELDLDDVRRIARSGRHLLALVSDVLDMSKIEAGSLELHPAPFSISEMLDEVREVATSLARTNDNRLVWDVGPMTERVTSDELRLRQILLNLLSNALKFTREGEVRLAAAMGDGELRIDVSDTGPGIDPETLERLFLPFVQGRAHGLRHAGTGLGLAITHRLVSAMAGSIEVQSELGHGSRFTVLLPLPQ